MRTRFGLADTLRKSHTLDGVAEALSHLQDMMRLCRGDNMGLRELIPYMMLQLDRDQECYDFIKWYETVAPRDDYDWGDMDLPFLNVRDADPLEDTDYMDRRFVGLNHISAVMILKMKILIDCSTIRLTRRVLAGKIPVELWRMIEHHVIRSPISVKSRLCSKNSRKLAIIEDDLSKHIGRLGSTLCDKNEHFVAGLLDPDELLKTRPEYYSAGTVEETMLALQHGFPAWWQHEGVLELLHTAKAIAAKDSDIEIDDTIKSHPSSSRTKAELIEDVSRNRLWGYIDWAVEDSRDLSQERPSDRHMRELHERWRQCGMHDTDEGKDEEAADPEEVD